MRKEPEAKEILLSMLVARAAGGKGGTDGGTASVRNIEWHQCPTAVRNYLEHVTYRSDDYSTSEIATYSANTSHNSEPIGQTVNGVTYYNSVPNAKTLFVSSHSAGTLKPLDKLRWLKVGASGQNVRDLGGWTCDGGTVKYGKLIRGGEFTTSDTATIQALRDAGVRAQLDLRGTASDWTSSPLGADVDFLRPVGKKDGEYWAGYRLDDTTPMRQAFRFIFDAVRRGVALYFHCSAGADRTGTIACLLEGLLGVSQPDCDKDYELTSFTGEGYLRKRSGVVINGVVSAGYKTFIERITALSVGTTFRDKIVNYIASLGFTAAEINAFRAAMIDGEPAEVTPVIATYSVTKTLSGAVVTGADSAVQYQGYSAEVLPADGEILESVRVTMGGVDITAQVFSGERTELLRSVTKTLTHCSIDNALKTVIDGQSYGATLTADVGYTMDNVIITIGGVKMPSYYANGRITIPNVTGDIVITATAVASAAAYTNQLVNAINTAGTKIGKTWMYTGKRYSSSSGDPVDNSSTNITGLIPAQLGDVIRLRFEGTTETSYNNVKCFKADRSEVATGNVGFHTITSNANIAEVITNDIANGKLDFKLKLNAGTKDMAYFTFCTTTKDIDKIIITINEEIV